MSLFDRYAKAYPDIQNGQTAVLKHSDFIELMNSQDLAHNDLVYLSKIAAHIPLNIFNILFSVSDLEKKGYLNSGDFDKLTNQLILNSRNKSDSKDLDGDINKLLFFVCKIYESNSLGNTSSAPTLNQSTLLSLVEKYNKSDLPYINELLHKTLNPKSTNENVKNDNQSIDLLKFSNLMDQLPEIKFNYCFQNLKSSNNTITPEQLKSLTEEIFYHKLPPLISQHLQNFAYQKYGNELGYDESQKLVKLIRDLPKLNYLTYEKITVKHSKFITSNSLLNYINDSTNNETNQISKDEILLYFNWSRYTSEHLKNHPTVDPSELLAILTDDMVISNEVEYSDDHSSNFLHVFKSIHSFVLGSIAGMIGASIVYPIDIVKTRMQNQKNNSLYRSYFHCFKTILKNEGFFGIYSGLLPQIVGVAPEKAIKLTLNDLVRGLGKKNSLNGDISLGWEVLAGSTAGLCQVIVTNPLEVSKIRLQTQGEYISMQKAQGKIVNPKSALDIVRELGLKGLYRGAGACLLRDIPFSSIYFPTYANIKKYLFGLDPGKPGKKSNLDAWELLASGGLAGIPAAVFTTPSDVIKTRIQTKAKPGEIQYTGVFNTFKRILVEEGPRAFFKGGIARVCRSSPQFGFTLAAYELFQKTLPLSLFYENDSEKSKQSLNSSSQVVVANPISISENSKRFKLSSSASSADLNPTLLALSNYYKSLESEKKIK